MNRLTCSRISWLATLCPSEAPKFQNICLIKRAEDFFMRPHGFLICTLSYLTVFIGRIVITQCALQINFRHWTDSPRRGAVIPVLYGLFGGHSWPWFGVTIDRTGCHNRMKKFAPRGARYTMWPLDGGRNRESQLAFFSHQARNSHVSTTRSNGGRAFWYSCVIFHSLELWSVILVCMEEQYWLRFGTWYADENVIFLTKK